MSHRRPQRRRWVWVVASLFAINTIAIIAAKQWLPSIYRAMMLARLSDDDAQRRAEGLQYIRQHAAADPSLIDEVIARLSTDDEQRFAELFITLDRLGVWSQPPVPNDPYLRAITYDLRSREPDTRISVAQRLIDLPQFMGEPRYLDAFAKLCEDEDEEVRYNALVAIAELRGLAASQGNVLAAATFTRLLQQLANDKGPSVAKHAYITLGLINDAASGFSASWRQAKEARVAGAILWAALHTNPTVPKPAIEALLDDGVDPQVRGAAAYALSHSGEAAAREALIKVIEPGPRAVTDANQVIVWRAILALPLAARGYEATAGPAGNLVVPHAAAPAEDPAYVALQRFLAACTERDYREDPRLRPLILACLYRDRRLLSDVALAGGEIARIADDPLAMLAMFEGVPPAVAQGRAAWAKLQPTERMDPRLQLAALAATEAPRAADFLPLLAHEHAMLRDQACIVAIRRLKPDDVAWLIRRLLQPASPKDDPGRTVYRYDHGAKRSALMLAGLTGLEPQVLKQAVSDFSEISTVRDYGDMALWMRSITPPDPQRFIERAGVLLTLEQAVPTSTLLLGLLSRQHHLAYDHLLTPRVDARPRLLDMLDQERWWTVLEHFLPADAPRVWVWGDPELTRFQLDLLRDWYLLKRGTRKPHPAG